METLWALWHPTKDHQNDTSFVQRFTCSVLHEGNLTPWFAVETGLKQGCMLSPLLFLIALDWVTKETTSHQRTGIRWKLTAVLEGMDYADDICFLSSSGSHLSEKTAILNNNARKVGLKINIKKPNG